MARTTLLLLVVASFLVQLFSTVPPAAATSRMLEEQQARFYLVASDRPGYFPWLNALLQIGSSTIDAGLSAAKSFASGVKGIVVGVGNTHGAGLPNNKVFINGPSTFIPTVTVNVDGDSRVHAGSSADIHLKGNVGIPFPTIGGTGSIAIVSGKNKGDGRIQAVQNAGHLAASGTGLLAASVTKGNTIGGASSLSAISSSADSGIAIPVRVEIVGDSRGFNTVGGITNNKFNDPLEVRKANIQPKIDIGVDTINAANKNHEVGFSFGRNTANTKNAIRTQRSTISSYDNIVEGSRNANEHGGIQVVENADNPAASGISDSKGNAFGSDTNLATGRNIGIPTEGDIASNSLRGVRNAGVPSKIDTDISTMNEVKGNLDVDIDTTRLTAISNSADNKATIPIDGIISGSRSSANSNNVVSAEGDMESKSNNVVAVREINNSNGFHEARKTGLQPKIATNVPAIDASKGKHDIGNTGLSTISDTADNATKATPAKSSSTITISDTDGHGTDGHGVIQEVQNAGHK